MQINMKRTRKELQGVSGAKGNLHRNIPTLRRRIPLKRQAQPLGRGGSKAVPKTRNQSAPKTGRGFLPPLNGSCDEAAKTEPAASNVRNVKRLVYVKPVPEVCRSTKKLKVAQKTGRKNIPEKVGRRTGTAAFEGKNIRLLPDRTEISSSRELVLKENNSTINKPSNFVRRKVSMPPKKVAESGKYSAAPKIGRRTGVAAFKGEKIRLLPDGTENFDDYFTDTTTTDSYLIESSPRKSSIPLKESSAITDVMQVPDVYNEEPSTINNDNEADATKIKISNKKKQKDKLLSTKGVRGGTRIRIPPLESWRGQRQVYKYKSGEGFVRDRISPGREEDDACRQAILKKTQRQKEMKMKEKKKGTSRKVPKTTVFDASLEKEVNVRLHQPFDFVEWTAAEVAENGKVPYYMTKTFASKNVTFGFLEICPLEMKASQYSPEENIRFLVVNGSLKVVIRKSEFAFKRLDTFIVPRKEVYSIENVGKTMALLSFCTFRAPFFPHQIVSKE